jgi:V/A-type H+-transporting ATPase subunit D
MTIKLTKTELRAQQGRLSQLERYLPTLQLKKAMLQIEVDAAAAEIQALDAQLAQLREAVFRFSPLLMEKVECNVVAQCEIALVKKRYENIAGVEIPLFERVVFRSAPYFLFDSPPATDRAIRLAQQLVEQRERVAVAHEKKRALEKELREVSIRVNLFEKILIPRAIVNIKKIRIFLGDQQLAAVAQAKVAKAKLQEEAR